MSLPADTFYTRSTKLIATARESNQPVISALAPIMGKNLAGCGMLHVWRGPG